MFVLKLILLEALVSLIILGIVNLRYQYSIEKTRPETAYNKKDFLLLVRIVRSWTDTRYFTSSVLHLNKVSDIKAYIEQINLYANMTGAPWLDSPSLEMIEILEYLKSRGDDIRIEVYNAMPYIINGLIYTEGKLLESDKKLKESEQIRSNGDREIGITWE